MWQTRYILSGGQNTPQNRFLKKKLMNGFLSLFTCFCLFPSIFSCRHVRLYVSMPCRLCIRYLRYCYCASFTYASAAYFLHRISDHHIVRLPYGQPSLFFLRFACFFHVFFLESCWLIFELILHYFFQHHCPIRDEEYSLFFAVTGFYFQDDCLFLHKWTAIEEALFVDACGRFGWMGGSKSLGRTVCVHRNHFMWSRRLFGMERRMDLAMQRHGRQTYNGVSLPQFTCFDHIY